MGCGPTTVNITTTGEGEAGEESSTTEMPSGSTGLGGSESGPVDTPTSHGASSSGADSSSTTGGGGSSSSGGPSPVCLVPAPDVCICDGVETEPESTPPGCFCGDVEMSPDACCLPFEQDDGSYACFCYGEWVDPSECECFDGPDGCECEGFQPSDVPCLVPPTDPCMYDVTNATCACDGIPSDPSLCDCVPVAGIPTECACDGVVAPAELCS